MFVGEAPGDLEDRAGHPFVGPAGKLLDTALVEAGIDRSRVYVTNSVKHFKFVVIEPGRRQFRVTQDRAAGGGLPEPHKSKSDRLALANRPPVQL